jgi:hypothetical protein
MAFNLVFKLEYFKGVGGASDEGCFVQLKTDVPAYCSKISKEEYVNGGGNPSDFMDGIFAIAGITVAGSGAFRVYVEKSPLFTWSEILGPLMEFIRVQVGAIALEEAAGSPTTLVSENDRRSP